MKLKFTLEDFERFISKDWTFIIILIISVISEMTNTKFGTIIATIGFFSLCSTIVYFGIKELIKKYNKK